MEIYIYLHEDKKIQKRMMMMSMKKKKKEDEKINYRKHLASSLFSLQEVNVIKKKEIATIADIR